MFFVLQHDALVEARHRAQGLGQGGGRPTEHLLSLRNAHWAAEVVRVPRPWLKWWVHVSYTCIFQRAWISAWPQISACGGNWKLRRKVILSIFYHILRYSDKILVDDPGEKNALRVMFVVFLILVFNFYFFRAETPTKQAKTPEMRFSCKTVNFFNTVINNISKKYIVWAGILTKHHQNH